MWKHKSRFKGRKFFGNYEMGRTATTARTTRVLKFKAADTGRETKPYTSHEAAKKDGWMRVQA